MRNLVTGLPFIRRNLLPMLQHYVRGRAVMEIRPQTGFAGRFYVCLLFVCALIFGQALNVAHAHPAELSGSTSTEISEAYTHQHVDHDHAHHHHDNNAPEQTACAVCLAITSEDDVNTFAADSPRVDAAFAVQIAPDFSALTHRPLAAKPERRIFTDRHLILASHGVRAPPAKA